MKFRGTLFMLVVAVILAGYVYWHEVVGGRKAAQQRAAASKLMGVERAEVQSLRIRHSGIQFEMQPRDGIWVLQRPIPATCDAAVIGTFLDTLTAARREDEVGRGGLERYGLDAPAALIELDLAAGRTRRLALGRINPQQTLVYALVDDSKEVVLTTSSLLTLALNNAFGWRDKSVIEVQPELVQRIRVHTVVHGDLVLASDPQHGWLVQGEVPWRADPVRARSLALGLSRLQAVGVAAENKSDPARFGVDSRRFWAQLEGANGQVLGDLTIGLALAEGSYFATAPDHPEVWRVDGKLVELMDFMALDPRDRQALPPFDLDKVTRVGVWAPDDHFTLERREGRDWIVAASTRVDSTFAIDAGRMADALSGLAALRVQDFPAQQPARSGFEPPLFRIELFAGDRRISGLEVGRKDPKGMYTFARGPGEPAVFLISPGALLSLPIDLERLKPDEVPAPEGADRS